MKDLVTLVSGIEFKARKLADRLHVIENENVRLQHQNKQLLEEREELKLKLKQLEYSNQIIKIAKALEGNKGSTNAKLLINELLREIDRCIGLLND
ncbi:MAG: hypothetical protein ACLFPE_05095 [Bacteroidales bacterium]